MNVSRLCSRKLSCIVLIFFFNCLPHPCLINVSPIIFIYRSTCGIGNTPTSDQTVRLRYQTEEIWLLISRAGMTELKDYEIVQPMWYVPHFYLKENILPRHLGNFSCYRKRTASFQTDRFVYKCLNKTTATVPKV